MELNTIKNQDCLIGMDKIADKSIDLILADLPYGTTACAWDTIIPFEPLWEQYKRVIKDNGAIVLTASQPFTTDVIISNRDWFKYELIWDKDKAFGIFNAKKQFLKKHENICIFYKKQPTYNPQMKKANKDRIRPLSNANIAGSRNNITGSDNCKTDKEYNPNYRYPDSILQYSNPVSKSIHPTQKPVKLFEYLIKTYTNENETVLDNCIGSGTTAIACINTKRNYIGFEMNKDYFDKATKRIKEHKDALDCKVGLFSEEVQQQLSLF